MQPASQQILSPDSTIGIPVNSQSTRTAIQTKTMKAITQRSYGLAEVLSLEELAVPPIEKNEVLIEVRAAGLDRGTWHLMTGTPYLIRALGFGLTRPKQPVPGFDVAGIVTAVGSEVTRFAPGDAVYGIAKGSFAEYAAALEDKLVLKPADLSFESAAAMTISGITALEALTDVGNLEAGQHALVIGASGGVGTFTVQLAKALGAKVTGVASAAKSSLVRSLGADDVIDYRSNYLADHKHQYDLIIDIGGRNPVSSLRRLLTERGTIVFVGGEGGNRFTGGIGRQIGASLMSPFVRHNLKMFVSTEKQSMIARLNEFVKSGAVKASIDHCYPLDAARTAMSNLEAGKSSGKSIIVVRPSSQTS